MVRSQIEKDRAANQRLQHKYGITLADRDERIRQQDNKCKICSGPLDPPCTDHFHFKIRTIRCKSDSDLSTINLKWAATSYDECGRAIFTKFARTKTVAIVDVKKETMPWSIRALLCRHCNRALGMLERWYDAARHPENVEAALNYLKSRLQKS